MKEHATKTGTWGLINVLEGCLLYSVEQPHSKQYELKSGEQGVVAPTMLHSVKALDEVRFFVEFFRRE